MPDASDDADYAAALARLAALARFGMRPGLESIDRVLAELGHPERRFPSLHIAGTNGKGSTAAFAESMLRAAGARTALYTSPHLSRYTERIRVGGEEVARGRIAALLHRVLDVGEALDAGGQGPALTFFEAATAAAFLHFADEEVDVAVVECGLGGRLDATSTCVPFASVVTRIALDHTEILGDTLEQIAHEKAGIARAGVPLLVGEIGGPALAVIAAEARAVGAPLLRLGVDFSVAEAAATGSAASRALSPSQRIDFRGMGGALLDAELSLEGAHQRDNAALAIAACSLAPAAFRPDERARRQGLGGTRWPGRMERLADDVLVDAAHNPDGAAALVRALSRPPLDGRKVTLLVGVLADKDVDGVLATLLPSAERVFCTRPSSPRALSAESLRARVRSLAPGLPCFAVDDPFAALKAARVQAGAGGSGSTVVACGSIFLVGLLRAHLLGEAVDPLPVSDTLRPAQNAPEIGVPRR